MNELITAHVSDAPAAAAQGSPFAMAIDVSGHHILGDEPPAIGGLNLGPAPFDLLTAALAECTAMTVRWFARQQGWPLDHVDVVVEHEKAAVEGHPGKIDVFRKSVSVTGDLTDEQKTRLIAVAQRCPVQKTLEGPVQISTASADIR